MPKNAIGLALVSVLLAAPAFGCDLATLEPNLAFCWQQAAGKTKNCTWTDNNQIMCGIGATNPHHDWYTRELVREYDLGNLNHIKGIFDQCQSQKLFERGASQLPPYKDCTLAQYKRVLHRVFGCYTPMPRRPENPSGLGYENYR